MLKSISKFFAFLVLTGSPCLAGDADTNPWMYPVLRWKLPEPRHLPIHEASSKFKRTQMIVPDLALRGATLAEAIAFLSQASITADLTSHTGIQFHWADGLTESRANVHITLFLHDTPLSAVAYYVALSSGCRVIETENDFVFVAQYPAAVGDDYSLFYDPEHHWHLRP